MRPAVGDRDRGLGPLRYLVQKLPGVALLGDRTVDIMDFFPRHAGGLKSLPRLYNFGSIWYPAQFHLAMELQW